MKKGERHGSYYPELNDKEWLFQKYHIGGLTTSQIAKIIGCSKETVRNNLVRFEIERHPSSMAWVGAHLSDNHKEKISDSMVGLKRSDKTKEALSQTKKKQWQDKKFVEKMIKSWNVSPNKPEQKLNDILQNCFPNEWKFNGDFSCGITIGGMIPDFVNVNGMKAVIEVFGDVFHNPDKTFRKSIPFKQQEFGRQAIYSQFGYKCVIFWASELEGTDIEGDVRKRIKEVVK